MLAGLAANAAAEVRYYPVFLGWFPNGTPGAQPLALNDFGESSGYAHPGSPDNYNKAYFWSEPTGMLNLGTLPGGSPPSSRGEAINNLGRISNPRESIPRRYGHEPAL